ncbi:MAG: ATP-binding cassette domain-containing protein [candidate division KSB1 bacterium]|nr:ATP-binding cassette domain-containing protein [candidate division KSB1 bacterium]MDZ7333840.1 ATP-binding cassette domain-containing protein [candidate division KSB1 bacterium]MDZ7356083.1 ATP-binding cassette domain-containing protein [candidate division KSB1 bacterium]MDZ7400600.1 ATP-binding cassette domain-containing protein [candidate division KSB1 bacterium]
MSAMIEIRNLIAQYNDEVILDDISIDIFSNEITVILGRSGCGKTTLLKNIIRLYEPTAGAVKIMGQDITRMDETEFNTVLRQIGVLFQNGALLNSLTVAENVAIPLEQHTNLPAVLIRRLVREKLHLVELDHALNLLPSQLSGGMRKRAALARAIALDPAILFADEPTAGLDPVTAAALDKLLLKLRDILGMTLVIVTHELESIHRIADRVVFMEHGRVLFQGKLQAAKRSPITAIQRFFNP